MMILELHYNMCPTDNSCFVCQARHRRGRLQ